MLLLFWALLHLLPLKQAFPLRGTGAGVANSHPEDLQLFLGG